MKLPIIISVPHAGLAIPPEVETYNILTQEEIICDGDECASEIYAIEQYVQAYVTTEIARAFVDVNRPVNDLGQDGIVKTHTCWGVPIYTCQLSEVLIEVMIRKYYRPYHEKLTLFSNDVKFGIDCHTMAEIGPPVSPDSGQERPLICVSDADGTFPADWLKIIKDCFQQSFQVEVSLNRPFKGGHIIQSHASEIPWVQIEISRSEHVDNGNKKRKFLDSIEKFCSIIDNSRTG
jgi:formiminoglutamase